MKIAKIFTILARAGLALGGIGVTIPGDGTSTEFVEVSTSSALGGGTSMAEIYKVSFIKVPTSVISTELNSPVESSVESVSGSVTSAGVSSETLLSSVASSEAESTVVVSSTV